MAKRLKYTLIISSITAFVFFMGYLSFKIQSDKNKELGPIINHDFIAKYSNAITSGDLQFAYDSLTSKSYKSRHSLKDFLTAQDRNKAYFGKVSKIKFTSGIIKLFQDADGAWVQRFTVDYVAEKKTAQFSVDVIQESGIYKMSRSYPGQLTIRSGSSMIF